jgi:uncharacterized protein YneF (UPF0154 family)
MILYVLLLVCVALGVFIYIKHKQTEREIHKRERLEEKQEQLMEILRKRKEEQ